MKTRKGYLFVTVIVAGAALLAGFAAGSGSNNDGPERKYYPAQNPDSPFSAAVQAGDTLYLAGTIGLTPGTREVPGDPKQEARNALDTIKARLEAAGMAMDDLVVVQVFCSDVKHYNDFNEVYKTYFEKDFPARAFLGSGKLLFDARFEVQGAAVRR